MRKVWLLCLLLGLAAGAATPYKIEAGTGVGTITLGADSVSVAKALGVKSSFKITSGLSCIRSDESGLLVQYDPANGKVVMVTVSKAQGTIGGQSVSFAGDGGVTIGAAVPAMESAYGRDYEAQALKTSSKEPPMVYYAYKRKGIGFQFRGGALMEISVFSKH